MPDDDVPTDEMRWLAPDDDPIDAVLRDDPVDDDLLDVAAVVHDIRAAYAPTGPLRRSGALAAFTDAHLDAVDPDPAAVDARHTDSTGRKHTKMLSSISGFLGTLTGKAVLGTALAAATVGGMHAADVVDVPILPANDHSAAEAPAGGGSEDGHASGSVADAGVEGQMTAAEKQAAAEAHAQAVQEWTDCVTEAAASRDEADSPADGAFDPGDACGEMPQPGEFGLTDLPSQASDNATGAAGTHGAAMVPEEPGSTAPADEGTAPADVAEAPDGLPTPPAPTQPDAVPDDHGSTAPAPARPDGAPADTEAGQRP